jgi:hypothetical protein
LSLISPYDAEEIQIQRPSRIAPHALRNLSAPDRRAGRLADTYIFLAGEQDRNSFQSSAQIVIGGCGVPRGNRIIQKICLDGIPYGPDLDQLEADGVDARLAITKVDLRWNKASDTQQLPI